MHPVRIIRKLRWTRLTHHSLRTVWYLLPRRLLLVGVILPEAVPATYYLLPGPLVLPALLQLAALPRGVIVHWLFLVGGLHNFFIRYSKQDRFLLY